MKCSISSSSNIPRGSTLTVRVTVTEGPPNKTVQIQLDQTLPKPRALRGTAEATLDTSGRTIVTFKDITVAFRKGQDLVTFLAEARGAGHYANEPKTLYVLDGPTSDGGQ